MKRLRIFYFTLLCYVPLIFLACSNSGSNNNSTGIIPGDLSSSVSGAVSDDAIVDLSEITIELYNSQNTYRTQSAADGAFSFEGVAGGVYTIFAVAGDVSYDPQPDTLTVDASSIDNVNIALGAQVGIGALVGSIGDDIAGFNTNVTIYHVKVNGNYAYLVDRMNGMWITDITEIDAPSIIGLISTPDKEYNRIEIYENKLFVSYSNKNNTGVLLGGIEILNIVDPENPASIGILTTEEVADLKKSGDYVYAIGNEFNIVDVSDLTSPAIVSAIDIRGEGIDIRGDYAYVGCVDKSLRVIDISDVLNPQVVWESTDTSWGVYAMLKDDYVYIATLSDGMKIYDITDPVNPVYSGGFTPDDAAAADSTVLRLSLEGLYLDGNYAYLAAVSNGAFILDIYNRTQPVFIAKTDSDIQFAMNVYIAGRYGYAGSWDHGFTIFRAK